uniref:Cytochrome c oxidase subunit 2 n=1 Tax=Isorropodon fossajaponicum TaxID=1871144 RepID=A0A1B4WR23_9BIVA|nr:cytochrome c oxidase subunit II [Isorropodon fossajaponicum]
MGSWSKFWFYDMNTVVGQELILYNDLVMVVAVAVLVVVGWFMLLFLNSRIFFGGKMNKYVYHNELLEIMWTMVPAFMLCFLGYVSLMNLYIMEVGDHVENGMKVTAHQWYWDYSYIVDFSEKESKMDEFWLGSWFGKVSNSIFFELIESDMQGADLNESPFYMMTALPSDENLLNSGESFYNPALSHYGVYGESWVPSDESELNVEDEYSSSCLIELSGKNSSNLVSDWSSVVKFLSLFYSGEAFISKADMLNVWIPHIFLNCKWNYCYEVYEVFNNLMLDLSNFRGYTLTDACYLMSSVKNELLISTMDVMHSWGVGSLGVKCDAVPGRVNSLGISPLRSGVFFGNCYELCGEGHSMMPISVAVMTPEDVTLVLKQGVLGTSDCVLMLEEIIEG